MNFKDVIEKLKKETKFIYAVRMIFYFIGILLIFLGGIQLMTMFFIFLFSFILGRYYEKTMSSIRDYKLSQRVNKTVFKQGEYESMQSELETLRKTLQYQRKQTHNVPFNNYNHAQNYGFEGDEF